MVSFRSHRSSGEAGSSGAHSVSSGDASSSSPPVVSSPPGPRGVGGGRGGEERVSRTFRGGGGRGGGVSAQQQQQQQQGAWSPSHVADAHEVGAHGAHDVHEVRLAHRFLPPTEEVADPLQPPAGGAGSAAAFGGEGFFGGTQACRWSN